MNRSALKDLQTWYEKPTRKPLVLRGARQVGKSTLIRLFSKEAGLDLCEINLEKYSHLEDVFKTFQVKKILTEIQAIAEKRVHEKTLLFLDEVQAVPSAIACLRYFYEEMKHLAVIAAGSLLDFALGEALYSVPVGRIEYYHLGPLSFEEYLEAKKEIHLLSVVKNFTLGSSFAETDHHRCLEQLKSFYFVGGMPEPVSNEIAGALPREIQTIQRSLISTFQDDFNKYARHKDIPLLREIFGKVSLSVGRKVKYVELARDEKAREVKKCLDLLIRAKLVHPIFHSDGSGIPLRALSDMNIFKLIYLDIGLLNANLGVAWEDIHSLKNEDLLTASIQSEQFVGQTLLYLKPDMDPELHYWQREGKSQMAEVDYLMQAGRKIIPIEVKAGTSGKLRSLHQFILAKKSKLAIRFDAQLPSENHVSHRVKTSDSTQEIAFQLLTLPVYFAGQIERILAARE